MILIAMGVAGSGKTTIGQMMARAMGWRFLDADDLHSPANREKMSHGVALTDDDRKPWLEAVRKRIQDFLAESTDAVIACSALKQSYRDLLVMDRSKVKVVYLKGERKLIAGRLALRHGHFFNEELLKSQFDALEEPRDAIVEDITRSPQTIVESIRAKLAL
jgi:gluconokinase